MSYEFAERFVSRLLLENQAGATLSDTRIRLLEQIDQLGSISQAAKAVPLSYKAAWDALDLLNNTAPEPLVERATGGRQGGGTRLTEYGRRMVMMYRALEIEYQATLDRVMSNMNELQKGDVKAFQRLMHRMAIKTSARNQFSGPITGLRDGGMNYLVYIQLSDSQELVAMITRGSVKHLNIRMGSEIFALFKATNVQLLVDRDAAEGYANQLWGEVQSVSLDRRQVEVLLKLPGERSVTALISQEACESLDLRPGSEACACFDAETVTLACYD